MTRRLGGPKKSLAAIASVTLAATLAWAGAMTGCGSSGGSQTAGDGGDGSTPPPEDAGLVDTFVADTFVPPADTFVPDTFVAPTVLGAPTFTPPTGMAFTGTGSVTINPPAGFPASGSVYYTTNGTNPNPNSQVVVGPIQVSMSETISAYASAPGYQDSVIARAMYTVTTPPAPDGGEAGAPPTVPVFMPTSTKQNNDFKVAVQTSAGATVCYTLDGVTTPTCNASGACTGSSLQYNSVSQIQISGSVTNASGSVTVQAISCEAGQPSSAVSMSVYVLQVADPSFSNPGPGTVLLGVTPIVQSTTTGATISYTTTATAPTCINGTAGVGTAVSDPHTFQTVGTQHDALIASTTYKTIGCKPGYAPSNVSTSAFTVQLNALTFPTTGNGLPGTYDQNVTTFSFGDTANNALAAGTDWGCYSLTATAPTCGATMGTCGAGNTATAGGLSTANPTITTTGTTLTVIDCALGYTPSAAATGAYVLQLDPPDLNLPGVSATGAPLTSYTIPTSSVGSLLAVIEQSGAVPGGSAPYSGAPAAGAKLYDYLCLNKGAVQCGVGACAQGLQVAVGSNVPPAAPSIVAGDSWSVVGCSSNNSFMPSATTTVVYNAPGTASPPLISPSSGTFTTQINPTITNTDTTAGGSTLCSTQDGSTPTCSGTTGNCTHGTQTHLAAAGGASVTGITVTAGGTGYASAPSVVLSGGGATTQQTATSTLTLTALSITNPGAGYLCAPTVSIGDALVTPTTASCAIAQISAAGAVSSLVFDPACVGSLSYGNGDGFVSPTIVITPSCAETPSTTATASVTGSVDFIALSGTTQTTYSTPPTVTITGSGTGAAAFATTSNSYQPGNMQYNSATGSLDGTINVLEATVCNTMEAAPAAVTGTYTFTLAEPDVTSVGGTIGNLNGGGAISAGQHICITTASNFTSEVINVTYGATTVTCGSGLPAGATTAVTQCPAGSVEVTVPSTATFTVNAIACGNTDTAQNSSPVRSAAFEGISTAPPVLTTNQVVLVGGLAGCQSGTNCQPVSPWYNPFNVYLTSATPGATVCYNVTGGAAPSCTAGGTCTGGTPYTAAINIATSGTKVQAVACSSTNGTSTGTSSTFTLDVSPLDIYAAGSSCSAGIDLGFYNANNGTTVDNSVAALGGATAGALICFTVDGSPPGCATTGSTTCATATETGALSPNAASTAFTGAISSSFTLTWQGCGTGASASFVPTSGSQVVSTAPFRHSGTITLDGTFSGINTGLEEGCGGTGTGAGELNRDRRSTGTLFTYDATNLYFGVENLFTLAAGDYYIFYIGNGVSAGAAPSAIPAALPAAGNGRNLPAAAGIQYAFQWLTSPGTAAPTAFVWNNAAPGWQAASGVTVNFGFSAPDNNVEFSIPISQLPNLVLPLSTVSVIMSEVSGVGGATRTVIDWSRGNTCGNGGANELQHGFMVNYASCEDPNLQLF